MTFNILWGICREKCLSSVCRNRNDIATGGPASSQEKVGVGAPAPDLCFSCLVILASSSPPITLVLFRVFYVWQGSSWYTHRDMLVCVGNTGGVYNFLKAMRQAVSLCTGWTLKQQCISFCLCERESSARVCAFVHVLVSVTSSSICPLSLKSSVHLVRFWETAPRSI